MILAMEQSWSIFPSALVSTLDYKSRLMDKGEVVIGTYMTDDDVQFGSGGKS